MENNDKTYFNTLKLSEARFGTKFYAHEHEMRRSVTTLTCLQTDTRGTSNACSKMAFLGTQCASKHLSK